MIRGRAALVLAFVVLLVAAAHAQVILRRPGEPMPTLPRSHGQVPRPAGQTDSGAPYVLTIRVFVTPQDAARPLQPGQGVALLLTDAGGRRFGRDPDTNAPYGDIPDASYDAVTNPQPNAPVGPRGLVGTGITLRTPGEGTYALDVIGTDHVRFDYVLQAWDRTGRARWTHFGFGFTEPGFVDSYEITYSLSLDPPIWISEKPDNSYLSVSVFGASDKLQAIVTEALLLDPRGRRLGAAAGRRTPYAEIPRAMYSGDAADVPTFEVPRPLAGAYVVEALGSRRGRYTLEAHATDIADASTAVTVDDVPTAKGVVHRYRLEFAPAVGEPLRLSGGFGGPLLTYASPTAPATRVPAGQTTFPVVVFYGSTIEPATFRATLNGADATARFAPRSGGHQVVSLPLRAGANVLTLAVAGRAASGAMVATTDRLELHRGVR